MHGKSDNTYLKSSFYEQMVEYRFLSELLQEVWFRFGKVVEVLHSKVDASGYDVVLECNGYIRHVQLKTSKIDGKTAKQNVNIALGSKPSGCVIWIQREDDLETCRIKMSYRYFGDKAGKPLPSLEDFSNAKHAKPDMKGKKKEKPSIKKSPRDNSLNLIRLPNL